MKDMKVSEMLEAIEKLAELERIFDAFHYKNKRADDPILPVKNQLIMVKDTNTQEWFVREFLHFNGKSVACRVDYATTNIIKGKPATGNYTVWEEWKFID